MKINIVEDFNGVTTIPNGFDFTPFFNEFDKDFRPVDRETLEYFKNKNYRIISGVSNAYQDTYTISNYTFELTDDIISKDLNDIFIYILKVRELFEFSFNFNHPYNDNVSLVDTISPHIREFIKHPNFYIYIEYTWEGQFLFQYFHKIYFDLQYNKIPANKVIFCTNTQNINELHYKFLLDFPKEKTVKFTHHNQCLLAKRNDYINNFGNNTFVNESILNKIEKREKKALMLNRRLRIHRLSILSLLLHDKLYEETLSSFDIDLMFTNYYELDNTFKKLNENKELVLSTDIENKIKVGFDKLKIIKKSTVDFEDLDRVIGLGYESKEIYEKTYFSIVTETLFVEQEKFVSEKTYKPILHYHPFVIVGSPNTLTYLKSYGFKTFDKWWDESYDNILDNGKRLEAVYKIIKELLLKTDNEWVSMLNEMKSVLIHNKEILLSFSGTKLSEILFENTYKIIKNNNLEKDVRLF